MPVYFETDCIMCLYALFGCCYEQSKIQPKKRLKDMFEVIKICILIIMNKISGYNIETEIRNRQEVWCVRQGQGKDRVRKQGEEQGKGQGEWCITGVD